MKIKKATIPIITFLFISLFLSPYIVRADEDPLELSVICASKVNESYPFIVTVKVNNISIANATVTFNEDAKLTNLFGEVTFYAPRVVPDQNNTYNISVFKEGYKTTTITISVVNVPQLFPMAFSSNIKEETEFVVAVEDDEGKLVNNATITFNSKKYQTDINGTITLTTPSVNKSKLYIINVTKSGYIDNSIFVIIYPNPSKENIFGSFVVIGICIFIAVLSIAILIGKHLRRKRINRY